MNGWTRFSGCVARRHVGTVRPGLVGLLALVVGAAPAVASVVVEIGNAAGPPAASATLTVRLRTDGFPITGVQHELVLPVGVRVAPRPERPERPDCWMNPDLLPGEAGASFYWVPLFYAGGSPFAGCDGVACRAVGAQVLTSRAYLPDDVTLYTCTLEIGAEVSEGRYGIGCSYLDNSDEHGNSIPGTCAAGELLVDADLPHPTPRPTAVAWTPIPTPTACPDCGPLLAVGTASGVSGERVTFPVTLRTGGLRIAGLQVDIGFPAAAPIPPRLDRSPDCTLGDGLEGWSSLGFQPAAAVAAGQPASAIRALLITRELDPIADGATVLTCSIEIAAGTAPGRYPLTVSNLGAGDPDGAEIPLPGAAGAVEVVARQGEQPVIDRGGAAAGSGCAVGGAASGSGSGWFLLLPLLAALRSRRRRPQ